LHVTSPAGFGGYKLRHAKEDFRRNVVAKVHMRVRVNTLLFSFHACTGNSSAENPRGIFSLEPPFSPVTTLAPGDNLFCFSLLRDIAIPFPRVFRFLINPYRRDGPRIARFRCPNAVKKLETIELKEYLGISDRGTGASLVV
jgi:hypothetical protein